MRNQFFSQFPNFVPILALASSHCKIFATVVAYCCHSPMSPLHYCRPFTSIIILATINIAPSQTATTVIIITEATAPVFHCHHSTATIVATVTTTSPQYKHYRCYFHIVESHPKSALLLQHYCHCRPSLPPLPPPSQFCHLTPPYTAL